MPRLGGEPVRLLHLVPGLPGQRGGDVRDLYIGAHPNGFENTLQ